MRKADEAPDRIRKTLIRRRTEIQKEIRDLEAELREIADYVGVCRKSQYCMQEDGHSGGCTDYTIS